VSGDVPAMIVGLACVLPLVAIGGVATVIACLPHNRVRVDPRTGTYERETHR
jgi:hypothetical protein